MQEERDKLEKYRADASHQVKERLRMEAKSLGLNIKAFISCETKRSEIDDSKRTGY